MGETCSKPFQLTFQSTNTQIWDLSNDATTQRLSHSPKSLSKWLQIYRDHSSTTVVVRHYQLACHPFSYQNLSYSYLKISQAASKTLVSALSNPKHQLTLIGNFMLLNRSSFKVGRSSRHAKQLILKSSASFSIKSVRPHQDCYNAIQNDKAHYLPKQAWTMN